MDFNYLYYRQQVERIRAAAAQCPASREAHETLSILFEERIAWKREKRRFRAGLPMPGAA